MKRIKSNRSLYKGQRYRFFFQTALLLMILGLWLVSYHIYHFTRSRNALKSYANELSREDSSDFFPGGSLLSGPMLSTGASTLKQALSGSKAQLLYINRPDQGERFGELSIPKLDLTLPIYEGTGTDELDLGVGHYTGSVLPGEKDNCVLSGHRNTIFQELGKVDQGDALFITTEAGYYKYIVDKIRIVDKDDRTVIVPKPRATLTVSTCYPFEYIGSAPKRYVLVAHLAVD